MTDGGDSEVAGAQEEVQAVIEVPLFANYLRRAVPVLLEDAEDTPEALVRSLKEKSSVDCMRKFLGDPQVPVLLIQRLSSKGKLVFPYLVLQLSPLHLVESILGRPFSTLSNYILDLDGGIMNDAAQLCNYLAVKH